MNTTYLKTLYGKPNHELAPVAAYAPDQTASYPQARPISRAAVMLALAIAARRSR